MKTTLPSYDLRPKLAAFLVPIVSASLVILSADLRADVPAPVIQQFQPNPDGSVLLRWDATPDCAYRVLTSTDLSSGVWTPVDYLVAASNSVTWQANGQSGTARFYKLATDALSIQSVEPSLVSTGVVTTLYVNGQGFGSEDTLRLIGPGGPLTLTNRTILGPTLMSFTIGPGFTPDVPGDYHLEVTSGTTGKKATFTYAWSLMEKPAGSQALLEPPQEPPAGPSAFSINFTKIEFGDPRPSKKDMERTGHTGHVTLMKLTDDEAEASRRLPVHNLGSSGQDGVSIELGRRLPVHNLGSSGQDGVSIELGRRLPVHNLGSSGQDGVDISGRMVGCPGFFDDNNPLKHYFSGEVYFQEVDLAIPGRGLDFIWARTYRSRTAAHAGMSYSWTCSYDVSVSQTTDGIAVFDGTGRGDVYHLGTNGVYSRNEFFNEGRLTNGTFTLTFPDTGRWVFNPFDGSATAGKLAQIVDRNGNTMTLSYDSSGRLAQIVDDLDRTNTVAYNSVGQLASITDFSGRTVTYQYYSATDTAGSPGDLKSVTSPPVTGTPNGNDFPAGKTTTYTYSAGFPVASDNENHLLLSVIDGKGQTLHRFTYQHNTGDFAFLRCLSWQCGTNSPSYVTYLPLTASPGNNFATLKVVARDSLGNVREPAYDSRNRLVDLREFTGRAPKPGPVTDVLNRPVGKLRTDDPDFYETHWSWNQDSLCVQEIEPLGNAVRCIYERDYDQDATPRKKGDLRVCRELPCCADLDRDGFPDLVSRFDYDPRFGSPSARPGKKLYVGNLPFSAAEHAINTKGTGTAGRLLPTVNKRAINTKGTGSTFRLASSQPKIIDNDKGLLVSFSISTTDPRGNVTTCLFDPHGNCVQKVEVNVPAPVITWEPRVFDFVYNPFGQLTAVTNAADGNGYRSVDTCSYYPTGPQAGYVQSIAIDEPGVQLTTAFEYDSRGNLTRCIDPRTNDWLYTYNALDQLVQSSSPPLGGSGASYRIAKQYTYDAANNLTLCAEENRDQNGALGTNPFWRTQFVYDQQNRLTSCWRDKNGALVLRCTEVKYDANDNIILFRSGEAVNGNDPTKVTQFVYDERNLPFRCVSAPGTSIASTTQWDYNANGRQRICTCPAGAVISYTYDGFDRCIAMTDPMGNYETNRFDANGNLKTRVKWSRSNATDVFPIARTDYSYDPLDRCMQSVDSFFDPGTQLPIGKGSRTTTYAYAPNGDCLSVTDDNRHTTRFTYDAAGRLATVTDPKTNTVSYGYDACDNVITRTQTDRTDLGGANQVFMITAQFDALNRCVSSSDNVGNTEQSSYDSRDNLVRHINPNGTLSGATYDGLNRCVATIVDLNGDGLLDSAVDAGSLCAYDDNDCVLSTTDANTNSTFYTYDAQDRCVLTTCADGTHRSFAYDLRGNVVQTIDPNGTVVTCTYDLDDRCIRKDIATSAGSEVASTTTFETFAYDGCSRLTLASNDVSRLTYAYDSLGDCTSSTQDGLTTTCTFDGLGNCLSMTYPGGRVVTYAYDALDQVANVSSGAGGLPPASLAQYQYEGPGRVGRVMRGNGVNTRINWNGMISPPNAGGDLGSQQVSRINHAIAGANLPIDQRSFAYDRNQNKILRAQMTEFTPGQGTLTNVWSYNPLNMMDHAINCKGLPGGQGCFTIDYGLDAVGNRHFVNQNGLPFAYTMDSTFPNPADFQVNQYTTTPSGNELHDNNGNLVQVTSSVSQTLYAYDYADRLVFVYDLTTGSAVPLVSFSYDALSNRISKTTYPPMPSAPVTTYFVHACKSTEVWGNGILEERVGGVVSATYVYDGTSSSRYTGDSHICTATRNGQTYYYHTDDLGNVLALTDAGGNVLERYEYDDFGAPQFLTSDGVPTSASASPQGNPFLFHGMEWDSETALYHDGGMIGNNPLYQDPKTGRSTTRLCPQTCVPAPCCRAYGPFGNNNPWSPPSTGRDALKGTTKTQGDFNLSNRFSFEIDGVVSRKSISVIFHNDAGEEAMKPAAGGGRKKEYVGHVTLMK